MSRPSADRIADAILYEGYLLYPYRRSAMKNRQRFNFGVLLPRDVMDDVAEDRNHERAGGTAGGFRTQPGGDNWRLQTECLVRGSAPRVALRARWLQPLQRQVEVQSDDGAWAPRAVLHVDGRRYETWQEAAEREYTLDGLQLARLTTEPVQEEFVVPARETTEPIDAGPEHLAARYTRSLRPLNGTIAASAERLAEDLFRLRIEFANTSPAPHSERRDRERALLSGMAAAHCLLSVDKGEFISLLEPPPNYAEAAAGCCNSGAWPVLIGDESQQDRTQLLSSPILLYDYPEIAPESPGDFFDGAEIDEMLTLRILTLTDAEKLEMMQTDPRAKEILERTERLDTEQLARLHGALRTLRK